MAYGDCDWDLRVEIIHGAYIYIYIYMYIYNDPKHTAKYASNYVTVHGINWFRTPAESPDLNPIEIVWHELKEFLRNSRKLCNKEQLIAGILRSRQT